MQCYLFTSSCPLAAIIAVAILGHCALVAGNQSTVNVGVYYESLCSDSRRFIENQLVPSYDTLKDYISITFIPYGKASHWKDSSNNEWKFKCQHGPSECEGNMAQACAIYAIQNEEPAEKVQQLTVSLVGCAMTSLSTVPQCAESAGLSEKTQKSITDCIAGPLSKDLLVANGEKTKLLDHTNFFVPTITINGENTSGIQNHALRDFKKLICDTLPEGSKPSQCSSA